MTAIEIDSKIIANGYLRDGKKMRSGATTANMANELKTVEEHKAHSSSLESANKAHLAIYDHLPRDINVLADPVKYQEWARKVLPRISSPAASPVFLDEQAMTSQTRSDDGGVFHKCAPMYSFKRQESLSSRSYKEHVKGRKVRPGLHRGSVSRVLRAYDRDHIPPKAPSQSPVDNSENHSETITTVHPFYIFAKTGDLTNVSSQSLPTLSKTVKSAYKHTPYRYTSTKRYFTITQPAAPPTRERTEVLRSDSCDVTRKTVRMPSIVRKTPKPTSLSAGWNHARRERTIPSQHEMYRLLPDHVGPLSTRMRSRLDVSKRLQENDEC